MIVFSLIACFLFWSAFQKKSERYYTIGMWILFIVTAFRYPALGGTDNFSYELTFKAVPTLDLVRNFETDFKIGYIYINSLIKSIANSYIFFQVIYTAICMFILHKTIKLLDLKGKEKCLFLFGYFCYKFIWYFWGTLRQNLADMIFWYCIVAYYKYYISNQKRKWEYLIVALFIPPLFHSSGYLNYILLPILLVMPTPKKMPPFLCIITIVSLLLFIFSAPIFEVLLSSVGMVDDRYTTLYAETSSGDGNIINYLFRLIFYWLFALNYNRISYPLKQFVFKTFTIVILIGSVNQSLMLRVYEYYAIGMYLSFTFIPYYFEKNWSFVKPFYMVAMIILLARFVWITDGGLMREYYFFWQETPLLPTEKIYGKFPIY